MSLTQQQQCNHSLDKSYVCDTTYYLDKAKERENKTYFDFMKHWQSNHMIFIGL